MTQVGMQILGIFIGLIFMWSTVDLIWPSLLGIVAFGMSDYLSMGEAIAAGLGSQIVWMLLMLMILSEAIRVSGVGEYIARWIITRKFLNGRPFLFTFIFLWCFFVCTILLGTIAEIFLSWAIFYSIAEMVGYQKGERYSGAMIIACLLAGIVGGGMVPFQGWMLALCGAYGQATGTPINYAQYMLIAFIIGSLMMLLTALAIKYVFRCDMSKLKNFDVRQLRSDGPSRMTIQQKCYLFSFLIIIIYVFATTLLPADAPGMGGLLRLTQAGMFALIIIIQCFIRIDGKPIINFVQLAKEGVNWNVILICSSAIPVASALTSDATGVKTMMNNLLSPVFSGMGALPFIIIVVVATVILTNIGSNIGVAMMLIPITVPFVADLGISPAIIGIAIIFLANMGFVLPGSSGMAPFLYSNDWITVKDIYKYGIGYCLICIIAAIPVLYIASFVL
ncbi:MAG: TRAP transporter large permease subunit [Peptococcaceae bacterium]|nr:TRAP transporter large permease subunit [Peptococcaceae bacterium]